MTQLCIYIYMSTCLLSHFSHVGLFASLWTVTCQAPLSREFSRQEYRSGLLCSHPGDLSNPGITSSSPALAGWFFTRSTAWDAPYMYILFHILFHDDLLQGIEYSSLCYAVQPCWLSILHIKSVIFLNLSPDQGKLYCYLVQDKQPTY